MLSLEGRLGVGACCGGLVLDRVREPSRDPKRELSLNWLCLPETNSCATSLAYTVLGVFASEPVESADSLGGPCDNPQCTFCVCVMCV